MIFKTLCINVGSNCNQACSYCFRRNYDKTQADVKLTDDMLDFLKNKAVLFKRIAFCGGEPLLYMNDIRKMVEAIPLFVEKYIYTNGTLLTEAFVDYFNANNVTVVISHDGESTKLLRGYDVLETNLGVISKIDKLGFSSVITPLNMNLEKVYSYIKDKVGRDFIHRLNFYLENGNSDLTASRFYYNLLRRYLVEYIALHHEQHDILNYSDNEDRNLGTQILMNGDVVCMTTLKRYGNLLHDDEQAIYSNIKQSYQCGKCQYYSVCTGKKQLKSKHYCELMRIIIEAKYYSKCR